MKIPKIFRSLPLPAALLLCGGLALGGTMLTGCSANDVEGLVAKGDVRLELQLLAPDAQGALTPVSDISLPAIDAELTLDVRSNTLWHVEITDCQGNWLSVDKTDGAGDGSFKLTAHDNVVETQRTPCTLWIYVVDAEGNPILDESRSYTVKQAGQSIAITPTVVPAFAADGNTLQQFSITVKGDTPWRIECPEMYDEATGRGYVEIDGPLSGNGDADFSVRLLRNLYTQERTTQLKVVSPSGAFSDLTVSLTQRAAASSFGAWILNPLMEAEGESVTITVVSPDCDWHIDVTGADWQSWLTVSPMSGSASDHEQTVTVTADKNTGYTVREARLQIVPGENTQNYSPVPITLTQLTSLSVRPIVSAPWIESWSPTSVMMMLSYLCPATTTQALRAEFSLRSASGEVQYQTVDNLAPAADLISAGFAGLTPKERYEVEAVLYYHDDVTDATLQVSSSTFFYTPGISEVSGGDNNPPSPNR